MRKAEILVNNISCGFLTELEHNKSYEFNYRENYSGPPVSLAMPTLIKSYKFDNFPPFFDGLLPEGFQLEALLKQNKIDRNDLFGQLIVVGSDVVGSSTIINLSESK